MGLSNLIQRVALLLTALLAVLKEMQMWERALELLAKLAFWRVDKKEAEEKAESASIHAEVQGIAPLPPVVPAAPPGAPPSTGVPALTVANPPPAAAPLPGDGQAERAPSAATLPLRPPGRGVPAVAAAPPAPPAPPSDAPPREALPPPPVPARVPAAAPLPAAPPAPAAGSAPAAAPPAPALPPGSGGAVSPTPGGERS